MISAEFLLFLVQHQAQFKPEDIVLNTRAFNWPREIETVMELATSRLNARKDFVEGQLKNRRVTFDTKIHALNLKIDNFKKKDPPVISMDEMVTATIEIEEISIGKCNKC
jgi:dynein heavy chain